MPHFSALDKPSVPRDVSVTNITAETATLSWQPPEDDGGKPVTAYVLEKRDASRQTWNALAEVDTSPYQVKGLVEGKQYIFRVCAKNEVGASKFAESETITAKNPFGKSLSSHGNFSNSGNFFKR